MNAVDDLLADISAIGAHGPMTWIEFNRVQCMVSAALYGGVKVCTRCRGVVDYFTEEHECQA